MQAASQVLLFSNPAEFILDLNTLIERDGGGSKALVVFDSVTLSVKTSFAEFRIGSPAGEKGLQMADVQFFTELNRIFTLNKITGLCVVNTDFIQFGDKLEGSVEGRITIQRAGQFTKRDRITRTTKMHYVSQGVMQRAFEAIGYQTNSAQDHNDSPFDMSGLASAARG